ncbi:hypothetical protein Tco_0571469 [Tanacetum coccineum]
MDSQIISLNEELQDIRNKYNELREGDGSDSNNDNSRFMEKLKAMDSQIISLNKELQDMRKKYNELRKGNTSKNHLNDDTPMCERHEVNSIQSEDYQNQNSHDSSSCQSLHDKIYDKDDVTSMFFKNNVNDMILKMKQNEKNFQTIFKNMERKIDKWEKSQNISLEQTDRTKPQQPPQAHTEHVNVVFTESGNSDDSPKTQKDSPPPIICSWEILVKSPYFALGIGKSREEKEFYRGVRLSPWLTWLHHEFFRSLQNTHHRAWRRLFEVRGLLVFEFIMEFFSTLRFSEAIIDIDVVDTLQFQLGGARRRMSWREFILALGLQKVEDMETARFGLYWARSARQISDKGYLSAYWSRISSEEDFLGTPPSYTHIRDPILRLCHRLIACSIVGRRETLKIDSDCQDLPLIDITELVRLQICEELDDTWAWVAPVPEAPQPPAAGPARTMAHRLGRLEEDIHRLQGALGEQKEVLDSMARDFSRFTTWTITGLSRMIDQAGVRYTSYLDYQISYVRHTKCRTDDASTSAPQKPDP